MSEKPERTETKTFTSSEIEEIKLASKQKEVKTEVFSASEIEHAQNESRRRSEQDK